MMKIIEEKNILRIPKNTIRLTQNELNQLLNEQNKPIESIQEIIFNNELEVIDYEACLYCSGLLRIIIPDSVKIIGDRVFLNSNNIEFISFGNGLQEIGSYVFYNMGKGKPNTYEPQIVFGKSIKQIGDGCFTNIKRLDLLAIPELNLINERDMRFDNLKFVRYLIKPKRVKIVKHQLWVDEYESKQNKKFKDITHFSYINEVRPQYMDMSEYNFTNYVFPNITINSNSKFDSTVIFKDADMTNIQVKNMDNGKTDILDDYIKVFKNVDFARYPPKKYPKILRQYYLKFAPLGITKLSDEGKIGKDIAKHVITDYLSEDNMTSLRTAFMNKKPTPKSQLENIPESIQHKNEISPITTPTTIKATRRSQRTKKTNKKTNKNTTKTKSKNKKTIRKDEKMFVGKKVLVIGASKHKGKRGIINKLTPSMASIQINNGTTISVRKTNLESDNNK